MAAFFSHIIPARDRVSGRSPDLAIKAYSCGTALDSHQIPMAWIIYPATTQSTITKRGNCCQEIRFGSNLIHFERVAL